MPTRWFKSLLSVAAVALLLPLGACSTTSVSSADDAAELIDSAERVFKTFWGSSDDHMGRFRETWPRAKGVVILPGVLKGGFFFGAEGGSGLMMSTDAEGKWGQPAFYSLAAGSFGLQMGIQASDIVLLLFSNKAVDAIIKNQGKLGADMGLSLGTVGGGVEASTTTNVGYDILAFSQGIGLFGGASLEGAILVCRNDLNHGFYGIEIDPMGILIEHRVENARADSLRATLNAH